MVVEPPKYPAFALAHAWGQLDRIGIENAMNTAAADTEPARNFRFCSDLRRGGVASRLAAYALWHADPRTCRLASPRRCAGAPASSRAQTPRWRR
jgi:hypothetical protein